MKKISMLLALLLGATLAFAQTGGDKQLNPQPLPPGRHPMTADTTSTDNGKKARTAAKKGHKGGKKSKKGSPSTTPPPK